MSQNLHILYGYKAKHLNTLYPLYLFYWSLNHNIKYWIKKNIKKQIASSCKVQKITLNGI